MKKVGKSYLALKHDVVTMKLPFPFLIEFPLAHKEYGEGKIRQVFFDEKRCDVSFKNSEWDHIFDVAELFDLLGMWEVDYDKLKRRSDTTKASYDKERRQLSRELIRLHFRTQEWGNRYGQEDKVALTKYIAMVCKVVDYVGDGGQLCDEDDQPDIDPPDNKLTGQ